MAILDLPDNEFLFKEWKLLTVQQSTLAGYTGRRKVLDNPWHARWSLVTEHCPIGTVEEFLEWQAFLARVNGIAERFKVYAVEDPQHAGSDPNITAGAQGSSSIALSGMPANGLFLPAGRYITVPQAGDEAQIALLTNDINANGAGTGVAFFKPPLRLAATISEPLVTREPYAILALDEPEVGWRVDPGPIYRFDLKASEAF